ncbi:uncharacterized protein LOC115968221 [Quercus lobata]|uniref:uncharacterized protein LOC115968221 n=1 Tax=Quercus lobata TaxID=97700 RepID=UPI00124813BD|nr:uncharacterized protein LOC115968221 [Quercus lobata]
MDEYVQIGEITTLQSLEKFVTAMFDIFSEEYLRKPNNEDKRPMTKGVDFQIVKWKLMSETAQVLIQKQKAESCDTATYQGRIWSRSEGRLQREPKLDAQASSSNSKHVTPITILKPSSIEETPLLQHHNPIFDL